MIQFVHERQQFTQLTCRESLARKPAKIISGEVRDQSSLVLSIGHYPCHQQQQVFSLRQLNLNAEVNICSSTRKLRIIALHF